MSGSKIISMFTFRKLVIFLSVFFLLSLVNVTFCTLLFCPTCDFDDSGFLFQLFFTDDAADGYQVYPTFFNIIFVAILSFVYTVIYPDNSNRKRFR